jgi:two-component system KDP operon response regulator KdpE
VDDDEDLLVALAAPLRRFGFDVAVATDAVTAVSSAVKAPPDAVVMDIGLPGGDGIVVMQRLHALPRLSGVPVVVLSGRDPAEHREAALSAGAAAYLAKPVAPDALAAAVIDALRGDAMA